MACGREVRLRGLGAEGGGWCGTLHGMNARGNPAGKVDWDGQHCRFCRFLAAYRGAPSSRMPNSSRFAPCLNLTFRVMGGKGGKIVARKWQHNGRVGGKKRQGLGGMRSRTRRLARGCQRVMVWCLPTV